MVSLINNIDPNSFNNILGYLSTDDKIAMRQTSTLAKRVLLLEDEPFISGLKLRELKITECGALLINVKNRLFVQLVFCSEDTDRGYLLPHRISKASFGGFKVSLTARARSWNHPAAPPYGETITLPKKSVTLERFYHYYRNMSSFSLPNDFSKYHCISLLKDKALFNYYITNRFYIDNQLESMNEDFRNGKACKNFIESGCERLTNQIDLMVRELLPTHLNQQRSLLEVSRNKHLSGDRALREMERSSGNIAIFKRCLYRFRSDQLSFTEHFPFYKGTFLHAAVDLENFKFIKVLLEQTDLLNTVDSKGDTPLHMAARLKSSKIYDYLIKKGADRTVQNKNGAIAAEFMQLQVPKKLVDAINKQNLPEIAKLAEKMLPWQIKSRLHFSHNSYYRCTALHFALMTKNQNIVEIILDKIPQIINNPDSVGNTALHLAAKWGNLDLYKYLRDNGADPDLLNRNHQAASDFNPIIKKYEHDLSMEGFRLQIRQQKERTIRSKQAAKALGQPPVKKKQKLEKISEDLIPKN